MELELLNLGIGVRPSKLLCVKAKRYGGMAKIGRNDPCWCGSGKKYKRCHLRMGRGPWRLRQLDDLLRTTYEEGSCLHPQASDATCSSGIIKAHTVPKSALKRIARNGHVYGFNSNVTEINRLQGQPWPVLIGVGLASTFRGFCGEHDNRTFHELDAEPFAATRRQILLLGYRAICRSLYGKSALVEYVSRTRNLLHNYPPSKVPDLADFSLQVIQAHNPSLERLRKLKAIYDRLVLCEEPVLSSLVLYLDSCPQFLCAEFFNPEFDFNGNRLQHISSANYKSVACLSVAILPVDKGGIAVFSWLPMYNEVCQAFVSSLTSRLHEAPSLLAMLCFEHSENVYLGPSWWEGLSDFAREDLVSLFYHGLSEESPADALSGPIHHRLVSWGIRRFDESWA